MRNAPIRQSDTQRHLARLREQATRIHELETTIKSLTARNTQLLRAANGPVATAHIAVVRGEALLAPMLSVAVALESQGRVPVVRWARDNARAIIGIELATVVPSAAQQGGTPARAEMACEASA